MKTGCRTIPHAFLLLLLVATPLSAASTEALRAGPVVAQLLALEQSVQPGRPFPVALRLSMDAGWHTYWRNPGDAGLPTTIEWDLPPGFSAGPMQWPVPRSLREQDFTTYGLEGEAVLLVEISPPKDLAPGTNAVLRARVRWLACRVECIPGSAAFALEIPVRTGMPLEDRASQGLFDAARARLPVSDPAVSIAASIEGGSVVLRVSGPGISAGAAFTFFPGAPGLIDHSAAQPASMSGQGVSLRLGLAATGAVLPLRLQGVLVTLDAGEKRALAVDALLQGPGVSAGPGAALPAGPGIGVLLAILLAFLGGLLLNLMPCVLPVLSLKIMSLVRHAQSDRRSTVAHGLVFSAGVLASFWLIAGLLIALRAGGQLLGWGFQFQSPGLVAAVALLFFLVGLNLFSVFEIGTGTAAAGARLQSRGGWAGSFFSGFLATAVATPCTAPFMGSALGYALSQPPLVSFAVFTSLALGMALPYVVLSAAPGLVKRIPRPGKWMESLKQAMGFPMMAAVVWMASVLFSLSGAGSLVFLLGALVAAAVGAWVWGRWGAMDRARASRIAAGVISLVLVAGSAGLAVRNAEGERTAAARDAAVGSQGAATNDAWEPWSPERLAALRAEGRPVFIDFSAEWCLTCIVNEKLTLARKAVQQRFREEGVALLKADWTDRSDIIAAAIAGYGRAGVPLYVLYGPEAAEPVLLPEVLTPAVVLAALDGMRSSSVR